MIPFIEDGDVGSPVRGHDQPQALLQLFAVHAGLGRLAHYWKGPVPEAEEHYRYHLLTPMQGGYYGDGALLIRGSLEHLVTSTLLYHAGLRVSKLSQDYFSYSSHLAFFLVLSVMTFPRHQAGQSSPVRCLNGSTHQPYRSSALLQIAILLQILASRAVVAQCQVPVEPMGYRGLTRVAEEKSVVRFQALLLRAMLHQYDGKSQGYSQTGLLIECKAPQRLHDRLVARRHQQCSSSVVGHEAYVTRRLKVTQLFPSTNSDGIKWYIFPMSSYVLHHSMKYSATLSFKKLLRAMIFLTQACRNSYPLQFNFSGDIKNIASLYKLSCRGGPAVDCHDILPFRSLVYAVVIKFLFGLSLAAVLTPGHAQMVPEWFEREYRYVIVDQDVRDVLNEFGRNISMPIVLSDEVNGRVRGRVDAEYAGEFINKVSEQNGLSWYQQGQVIYVDSIQSVRSRNIDVSAVHRHEIERLLPGLQIGRPLSAVLNDDELEITGPQGWIESVVRRVRALESPPTALPPADSVRVFRGNSRERISPDEE